MSNPTSAQLAPNVDPIVREYIDARIEEAVAAAGAVFRLKAASVENLATTMASHVNEMKQFEREVRSHLGIFVPEAT